MRLSCHARYRLKLDELELEELELEELNRAELIRGHWMVTPLVRQRWG